MKKTNIFKNPVTAIGFLFFLFISLTTSCIDEDYTTNQNHRLTFSNDTLRMDTLFTTIGSSTRQLMVYNTNKKAILIEQIRLVNGDQSGFVVNVDGMKGTTFKGVEIAKNDSLFIFVEAKLKPTQSNEAIRIEDLIAFEYNGIHQKVVLEAYGQDAIFWRGKEILQDTTIRAEKPIVIYDSLYVAEQAHLTLEAGSKLFLHNATKIVVDGKLTALGTLDNPVLVRGNRTDKLFDNLAYDQMPGQWGGIRFTSKSFNNQLTHAHIRGMDWGIVLDSSNIDQNKLTLDNCVIKNSNTQLIRSTHAQMHANNSLFSVAENALVKLEGGRYVFSHCTFGNYYPFGFSKDAALSLTNYQYGMEGEEALPLEEATFNNCLFWGTQSVEVNLQPSSNEGIAFEHLFNHCLIKAQGEDDQNFINTQWNIDPKFKKIDPDNYIFDLRIDSLSGAIGNGSDRFLDRLPSDIAGNPRSAGKVDIGAYQWLGTRE